MKNQIGKIIAALGVTAALSIGSVTAASAAPSVVPTHVAAQISPLASVSSNIHLTWNKTVAFAGCITAVGVPIGVAWSIATNPAALGWILRGGPMPASVGGAVYKYIWFVKGTCGYALFNIVYR